MSGNTAENSSAKRSEIYRSTPGYRIRLAREQIGFTQVQLAKEIHTTQQTIHDYEKNKRGRYADTHLLIKLSNRCEVTLDWLLKGKDNTDRLESHKMPILPSIKAFLRWLSGNKSIFYTVGLHLEDNSMVSNTADSYSFHSEDIIIISSSKPPMLGDYVIATTASKKPSLVFRQLLLENNHPILKPLNAKYCTMPLGETIQVIAVAVEHRRLLYTLRT